MPYGCTTRLTAAGVAGGARVTDVAFAGYIGTGQMGRNARYRLTWDRPDGRPGIVVGKFPTDDPTGRACGFGNGNYRTEWTFYQRARPHGERARAASATWRCSTRKQQNFVLLMEDLAGSEQGDQMRGLTVDEALLAVEQAVAFHAPRWGDPTLADLMTRTEDETVALLQAIYDGHTRRRRSPASARTSTTRSSTWSAASPRRWAPGSLPRTPRTPCCTWTSGRTTSCSGWHPMHHRSSSSTGRPSRSGPGTHDLAYMIGGSFEPEQRARVERGLVAELLRPARRTRHRLPVRDLLAGLPHQQPVGCGDERHRDDARRADRTWRPDAHHDAPPPRTVRPSSSTP